MNIDKSFSGEEVMSNTDKYVEIFTSVFGVESDRLDESFNFDSIDEWDSFTHLTLISELEDAFDIMFETDDILHFGGFMNGMEILKRYGVTF